MYGIIAKTCIALVAFTIFAGAAKAQQRFVANISGLQMVPPNNSERNAVWTIVLNESETAFEIRGGCGFPEGSSFSVHRDAAVGQTAPPVFSRPLPSGTCAFSLLIGVSSDGVKLLRSNRWYLMVSTPNFPTGEIRGQIKLANGTYNDYDGDGRTDIQVYRNSNNTFYALRSTDDGYIERQLGQPGDSVSLTVDWDGDGLSDFSVARYAPQVDWRILNSTTGTVQETQWGSSSLGDFFAAADYDGDGKYDIAVFRAGVWHIIESSTGNFRYEYWGQSGDIPAPNDFDGDGKADLAIARSVSGQRVWWIKNSSDGQIRAILFGLSSDAFFTGRADFDGDGKADILIIRNESGQRVFYILRSSDAALQVIPWGFSSDVVKLGDYDGDGHTDPAVTRAINGQRVFFILQSTTGEPRYETFGLQGDF